MINLFLEFEKRWDAKEIFLKFMIKSTEDLGLDHSEIFRTSGRKNLKNL